MAGGERSVLIAARATAASVWQTHSMRERVEIVETGGVSISVECFEPPNAVASRPAIVALHGSGGFTNGAPIVRALVAPVVGLGYSVFLPHYFERTGTARSDFDTSRRHFPTWLETVGDTLGFVSLQPLVDPTRIGVIGLSLGAFLGLSIATRDARVKAIVDFYGALPPPFDADAAKLPPTLMLHGENDAIVPVGEARRLEAELVEHGVPHEVRIYPNEGHIFSPLTALDAARRTMTFLGRWL